MIKVYKDVAGKYRWKVIAGNGEIVAVGEAYESASGAKRSAESLKRWVTGAPIVGLV